MKLKLIIMTILTFLLVLPIPTSAQSKKKKVSSKTSATMNSPKIVGKTYTGKIYMKQTEGIMDSYMSVYFVSDKKMKVYLSYSVVGPDEVKAIMQAELDARGAETSTVLDWDYTYKNGVVKSLNGTDRFKVKNNGNTLYYYIEGHESEVHANLSLVK